MGEEVRQNEQICRSFGSDEQKTAPIVGFSVDRNTGWLRFRDPYIGLL